MRDPSVPGFVVWQGEEDMHRASLGHSWEARGLCVQRWGRGRADGAAQDFLGRAGALPLPDAARGSSRASPTQHSRLGKAEAGQGGQVCFGCPLMKCCFRGNGGNSSWVRRRPGDLAAAWDWWNTQGKVPILGIKGNKARVPKPCAHGASVAVRGTCVLCHGLVALGEESSNPGLAANLTFGQGPEEEQETPGQTTF